MSATDMAAGGEEACERTSVLRASERQPPLNFSPHGVEVEAGDEMKALALSLSPSPSSPPA